MTGPLLEIRDLAVDFLADEGVVQAVRGVSFTVETGQTVALVGRERLGQDGDLAGDPRHPAADRPHHPRLDHPARPAPQSRAARPRRLRRRPSDPTLDPRGPHLDHLPGADELAVAAAHHRRPDQRGAAAAQRVDHAEGRQQTIRMLDRVGFPDPERAFGTYPFELSGGLRQRAMIAMALVCGPALLIADEPTTALDVTIQAQILQLMKELQDEFRMAILFITHDLGIVANMADEVVVLYHGRVMESGSCADLLTAPRHPYLKALLHAVPRLNMAPGERLTPIREVPASGRALLRNGRGRDHAGQRHGKPRRCCSRSRACARPSTRAKAAGSAASPGRSSRSTTSPSRSSAASRSAWWARAAAARRPCPRSSCARCSPMPAR